MDAYSPLPAGLGVTVESALGNFCTIHIASDMSVIVEDTPGDNVCKVSEADSAGSDSSNSCFTKS